MHPAKLSLLTLEDLVKTLKKKCKRHNIAGLSCVWCFHVLECYAHNAIAHIKVIAREHTCMITAAVAVIAVVSMFLCTRPPPSTDLPCWRQMSNVQISCYVRAERQRALFWWRQHYSCCKKMCICANDTNIASSPDRHASGVVLKKNITRTQGECLQARLRWYLVETSNFHKA